MMKCETCEWFDLADESGGGDCLVDPPQIVAWTDGCGRVGVEYGDLPYTKKDSKCSRYEAADS